MQKNPIVFLILASLFLSLHFSCKKDDPITPPDMEPSDNLTFETVINSGGVVGAPTLDEEIDTTNVETNVQVGNELFTCTTVTYDVNAASGGSSGFPLFEPGADVIYPGSMLQGNSLNNANPNPIVVERAGGIISTNILDGNLVSSFEVDKVSKSSVTDGINNIISNATGNLPANFNIRIESVQSREQFALALGVDVNSSFLDIESKLNYNSSDEKSTFLVSLNQSFYTMSFDLPTSLDKLFAPSVTPEQLANYIGENNPATYISSVTYGRIFYMLIESSSSQSELEIAVDAAFSGITVDVDASLDINYFSSLENVSYKVFAYGGEAGPTLDAIGETDLNKLKDILKQSSTLGSAKPLSYVVRNVVDNQIVATQLSTTYDVEDCQLSGVTGTLPALQHWTGHPLFDSFGPISAAYSEGNDKFILLNEQGQYLRSTFNNGVGLLEGPFEIASGYPLNGVGATVKNQGPDEKWVLFIDASGTQYTYYDQIDGDWEASSPLSNYPHGESPFTAVGINAIGYAKYKNINPNNLNQPYGPNHMWFNNNGDKYSRHYPFTVFGNKWSPVYDLQQNWGGGVLDGLIDGAGAAIGFTVGDPITGNHFYILFNLDGDQYVIYGNVNGTGDEAIGPFNL